MLERFNDYIIIDTPTNISFCFFRFVLWKCIKEVIINDDGARANY